MDSESLFGGLTEVTSIDLSKFDTSKVTNMSHIFANCNKLIYRGETVSAQKFSYKSLSY